MNEPPAAVVRPTPRRVSWAWAAPALAMLVIIWVVISQASAQRGTRIDITFEDAAGLDPGAELVHRGMRVGVVRTIELAPDLDRVRVRAELAPHASGLAREGARFWIVRPELSLRRVAGLETLLGPRYIAVEPGDPEAARRASFDGLTEPPSVSVDDASALGAGVSVVLRAETAAGVAEGSPVLYKGVPVGAVTGVALADDASAVLVRARVREARLVRENSRFWVTGGVGVDFGIFRGLTVQAPTIDRLVEGAISFATPNRPGEHIESGRVFELHDEPDSDWIGWSPSIAPDAVP
ncbi:MAG: MlaD family protein [Phycisphaerales bacterium]